MVRPAKLRRLMALSLALAACTADAPFLGESDEPVVILVLSRGPTIGFRAPEPTPADSTLHALVATLDSPSGGTVRDIARFTMRRRRDGALFDWTTTAGGAPISFWMGRPSPAAEWNAHLAWHGTGGRLGRADLASGDTYDLEIESEGRVITGSVTMPGAPQPTVTVRGADRVVAWAPVAGATRYSIQANDGFPFGWVLTDPTLTLTVGEFPPPSWLLIFALEQNLASYIDARQVTRSGIVGAYGVFGATAMDSVAIPPADAVARSRADTSAATRLPATSGILIRRPE